MMIGFARSIALSSVILAALVPAQTSVSRLGNVSGEVAPSSLANEIAAADSALFAAFNARDLKRFRAFFARDLEFYQDNEGVENYVQTMKDFAQMFGQPTQIRRDRSHSPIIVSSLASVLPI
jgi:hypothetical protein